MSNNLIDFCKKMKIEIQENKVLSCNAAVLIFNSELLQFIKENYQGTLIEYIYKNALSKNENDKNKVAEFFSRFSNTIVQLSIDIFEFKTIDLLLTKKIPQITKYFFLRKLLLEMKNLEIEPKVITSNLFINFFETSQILTNVKIDFSTFFSFLAKNNFSKEIPIPVDCLLFFLNSAIKDNFDLPKKTPLFVHKIKFRRCVFQIKACIKFKKIIDKTKFSNCFQLNKQKCDSMRKKLNSTIYFRKETFEFLADSFLEINNASKIKNVQNLMKEYEVIIQEQQSALIGYLESKTLFFENEKLAPHFIQLLIMKQNSDLKKFDVEMEAIKHKTDVKLFDDQKFKTLTKNFYLFEFIRRESYEALKKYLPEKIESILKSKFVKNEAFDRDMMSFIKKFETTINEKILGIIHNRESFIKTTFDRVKTFMIFDDIAVLLKNFQDQIDESTRFASVIPYLNHFFGAGDPSGSMGLIKGSKIMGSSKLGISLVSQKGLNLCGKCRGLMKKEKDEVISPEEAEKIFHKDMNMNKSILGYANKIQLNKSKLNIEEARFNFAKENNERIQELKKSTEKMTKNDELEKNNEKMLKNEKNEEKMLKMNIENGDGFLNKTGKMNGNDDIIPLAPNFGLENFAFKKFVKNEKTENLSDNKILNKNGFEKKEENEENMNVDKFTTFQNLTGSTNKNDHQKKDEKPSNLKILEEMQKNKNDDQKIPNSSIIDMNTFKKHAIDKQEIKPKDKNDDDKLPPAPFLDFGLNFKTKKIEIPINQNQLKKEDELPPAPMMDFAFKFKTKKIETPINQEQKKKVDELPPAPNISIGLFDKNKPKIQPEVKKDDLIPDAPNFVFGKKKNPIISNVNNNMNNQSVQNLNNTSTNNNNNDNMNQNMNNNSKNGPTENLQPLTDPKIDNAPALGGFKFGGNRVLGANVTKNTPSQQFQVIKFYDNRKMKQIFWEKIEQKNIEGTIWTQINLKISDLNFTKLLEYFEDKKVVRIIVEEEKTPQKIDLIGDDSRKNLLNISLTKLFRINKLNWPDLIKMIIEIDESKIGFDGFNVIKRLVPTSTEYEIAKINKEPMENLDFASRWICEALSIPRYEHRFNSLVLMREFLNQYVVFKDFIESLMDVCDIFQNNTSFQKFLAVCLDVGNILNINTRRGNAIGFKAGTIGEFLTCKSPMKPGLSLMEYMICEIKVQNPNLIDFLSELITKLRIAATLNVEDVVDEIMDLKRKFDVLRKQLELSENEKFKDVFFTLKFEGFFLENGPKIIELEEISIAAKTLYIETMVLLGETERRLRDRKSKEVVVGFLNAFSQMSGYVEKIKG